MFGGAPLWRSCKDWPLDTINSPEEFHLGDGLYHVVKAYGITDVLGDLSGEMLHGRCCSHCRAT